MKKRMLMSLGCALSALLLAACVSPGGGRATGPWDVAALRQAPEAVWGVTNGLVQEVYYAGAPYQGKPTRVFAYFGKPEGNGPFPAMLLVHGGGGKAFPAWAEHWAMRGYVALAMDTAGCGPSGRLPDGGPDQSDATKFRDFTADTARDMWTYHAIAAVLRGHGLLAARPEVDKDRIAVTGISWGGYLTCIVAGLDRDLKAAVPVYGCGFLHENSCWVAPQFSKMTEERRQRWVENFDPSRYLGQVSCPMLFVNGTGDFAYPLDSYRKSYQLVQAPVSLSVAIDRPHGHIWTFPEVDAFIDHHLKGAPPLPALNAMVEAGGRVSAGYSSPSPLARAEFCFTHDTGPWQKRRWETAPAEIADDRVTAALPDRRPLVGYLRVTDTRGLAVSTPQAEWE
jgi:dienelactone hydrolase